MSTGVKERASSAPVEKLWAEYRATRDIALRDRLILTLAPIVKYIVYRKAREIPAHCEIEDFVSCGLEAMMRSIDRYDPSKGATLEQFVWTRIHGAVLDELRKNDWAPRSLRRWERDIARARETFTALYERAPSNEELANSLQITTQALDGHLSDIHRSQVGSLNVLVQGDDDTTIERGDTLASDDADLDPEKRTFRNIASQRFRAAFDMLPERERQVAVRLYLHNMTLREIGESLGVSESRACQIHTQLRKRLRELLADDEQLFLEVAA